MKIGENGCLQKSLCARKSLAQEKNQSLKRNGGRIRRPGGRPYEARGQGGRGGHRATRARSRRAADYASAQSEEAVASGPGQYDGSYSRDQD